MRHTLKLYRAEQVRELDRLAIEEHGIPGYTLMNRAGAYAFSCLRTRWPEARDLTVLCGAGNNGGDGYVLGRLALEAGFDVQLIALKSALALQGDALRAAKDWRIAGGSEDEPDASFRGRVIVDALLGTGLDRPAAGDYATLIDRANSSGRPILALDVPSGLNSDTGQPLGACIKAKLTVSFIGRKRGLYTASAGNLAGEVSFSELDVPDAVFKQVEADGALLDGGLIARALPRRAACTHKGQLGFVLVVGGEHGYSGAPILSGQAALRAGSGLVTLASRARTAEAVTAVQPELMAHDVSDAKQLEGLLEKVDVVALGPGLGRTEWSLNLWRKAVTAECPLVLDADGLYWLAREPITRTDWVLTPHPGEAARLLDITVADVEADRFAAVRTLADRYQAVVVLKGWGSLIARPGGQLSLCPYGNPAMATAGMGDALTGIIASFIGQGLTLAEAAEVGVLVHAQAGDAAAIGQRQILASDLIGQLARILPS